jgi:NAD(P)-dependent dehydrogenase (short-subunit alcohol dehydrogenase family)
MPQSLLVTGASSGLGLATAVYLAERGFRVFATMRDLGKRAVLEAEAQRRGVTLRTLPLDVTDRESIRGAVAAVVAESGGIDGVVSNAGVQIRGYFEDTSEEEFRRIFETNFFGSVAVAREVVAQMRPAKRGRIVLVTSVAGRIPSLGLSAYSSSKAALASFGECLSLEVAPLGIHVSLVEPGIVNTEIWGTNRQVARGALDPASPYHAWFQEAEKLADGALRSASVKPQDVARVVHKALTTPRPRLRYLVGRRASMVLAARNLLPGEIFERAYARALTSRVTKPSKV